MPHRMRIGSGLALLALALGLLLLSGVPAHAQQQQQQQQTTGGAAAAAAPPAATGADAAEHTAATPITRADNVQAGAQQDSNGEDAAAASASAANTADMDAASAAATPPSTHSTHQADSNCATEGGIRCPPRDDQDENERPRDEEPSADESGPGPSHPRLGDSGHRRSERLLFEDNFDELDTSVWEHELTLGGGGNWEFQWYTNNRTNSYVRDGVLYLRPTLTQEFLGGDESLLRSGATIDLWGSTPADMCTGNAFFGCTRSAGGGGNVLNPIQSARLRSSRGFNFKYGRVEVRAQLPKGDWIWPAIWMLPRWNAYGGWPASGEIDIMESRGNSPSSYPNTPGVGGGYNSYSSTLHWGANWASNQYERTHGEFNGAPLADEFHTYGMLWNEQGITSYIDDESNTVLHVPFSGKSLWDRSGLEAAGWNNPWEGRPRHAPFDQEFFLLMNVAVGGTGSYFPDGLGGKPWSNRDEHAVNAFWNARHAWMNTWKGEQTAMKIDWVRVYQA